MTFPLPGEAVRGSTTGKPIMALLDLLGRTWALGIVWHLSKSTLSFNQLQHNCEKISPTLLTTRLKELQFTQLIEKTVQGYKLTPLGEELFTLIEPMGAWAKVWQAQFESSVTEPNITSPK